MSDIAVPPRTRADLAAVLDHLVEAHDELCKAAIRVYAYSPRLATVIEFVAAQVVTLRNDAQNLRDSTHVEALDSRAFTEKARRARESLDEEHNQ